jgi:hypothetical protein
MTAKDLLQDPSFPVRAKMPKAASAMVDLTQTATKVTASPASSFASIHHHRMYRSFISACVQSVVFQLAMTGKAVPLNFRSVAFLPDGNNSSELLVPQQASLGGLDLSLTAKGDILISMRVADNVLFPMRSVSNVVHGTNNVIRIAPTGLIAKIVDHSDLHFHQPAKTQASCDYSGEQWRKSVSDYLETCGIMLRSYSGFTWSLLRVRETADLRDFFAGHDETLRLIEWPSHLCFAYALKEVPNPWRRTKDEAFFEDNGTIFRHKSGEHVYDDPIEEALRFHAVLERSVGTERHDEQPSMKHNVQGSQASANIMGDIDWEPPQQSYTITQDMVRAMSVYPTPPDGIQSTIARSVGPNVIQRHDVRGNVRAVQDDEYSAASITDADFSFFDDPSPGAVVDEGIKPTPQVVIEECVTAPAKQSPASSPPVPDVGAIPAEHSTVSQPSKGPSTGNPRQLPSLLPIDNTEPWITSSEQVSQPIAGFPRPGTRPPRRAEELSTLLGDLDSKYNLNGRFSYLACTRWHLASVKENNKRAPFTQGSMSDPISLLRYSSSRAVFKESDARRQAARTASTSDSDSDADMYPSKRVRIDRSNATENRLDSRETDAVMEASEPGTLAQTSGAVQSELKVRHFTLLDILCSVSDLDWSLSGFPAPLEETARPSTLAMLNEDDFAEIVQLLSAQQSLSTRIECLSHLVTISSGHNTLEAVLPVFQEALRDAFQTSVCPSQQDSLNSLELGKVGHGIAKTSKFQPKPKSRVGRTGDVQLQGQHTAESSAFNIQVPMLHVRKDDGWIEVLSSAWNMWDILGLGPCNGPKRITGLCAYISDGDALNESIRAYFRAMRSAWLGNRLGSHELLGERDMLDRHGDDATWVPHGLLRVSPTTSVTMASIMTAYRECLDKLGKSWSTFLRQSLINSVQTLKHYKHV